MSTVTHSHRIVHLDYLKCILILLMISFHLSYFGDLHPEFKSFVYTFHMPGFLICSGFLCNRHKPLTVFMRSMVWLLVPYLVLEMGYVICSAFLPVRESVSDLSFGLVLDKLFVHPLGPYWYLHTLLICSVISYLTLRPARLLLPIRLALLCMCLWATAQAGIISVANGVYFLLGVIIRQYRLDFVRVFRPEWYSLIFALGVWIFLPDSHAKTCYTGFCVFYFMISFLLKTYDLMPADKLAPLLFLGRNTLVLFLFSPIFTLPCRFFAPYFAWDPTGISYLMLCLPITLVGSLATAQVSDMLGASRYLVGRRSIWR